MEELTIASITTIVITALTIYGIGEASKAYNVWKAPCTEVYNGTQLIYKGKANWYTTESRGTGTIFKEYEKTVWWPKQLKEIQSNEIKIITLGDRKCK